MSKLTKELKEEIIKRKLEGLPDEEIGKRYGITFKQLERIITEYYGVNISKIEKKKIKYWEPKDFCEEFTTVWSFKRRGDWATHDGRYRGNWSPYIPRNIILKYSKQGDTVLDYFVGGGTTAVEAKLLGRKCIAIDINPWAIELTRKNLDFKLPERLFKFKIYEPEVKVGDARNLSDIPDESIDLICAHPPYGGIISYSLNLEGDLSKLSLDEYLEEMKKVAEESFRVLKKGAKCAILIGDTRKRKYVVPIGFKVINLFLKAGFLLKELIIKRQHNCKTTGFWYEKSIKQNFLLLAHEYLPVFEKPGKDIKIRPEFEKYSIESINPGKEFDKMETTSVWIFDKEEYDDRIKFNLAQRYGKVILVRGFNDLLQQELDKILETEKFSFLAIKVKDTRKNGYIIPMGKFVVENINNDRLKLKEIVILVKEGEIIKPNDDLQIIHEYLLIYERKD